MYVLTRAVFVLQWQRSVVSTAIVWCTKPDIFTI